MALREKCDLVRLIMQSMYTSLSARRAATCTHMADCTRRVYCGTEGAKEVEYFSQHGRKER
ncbi:unnamed protein product [Ectocarpus sp. CCAP 1310/34]|nr:unnamed protein product [Ectocarpus sp. CCAP 1310/34]